MEENPNFVSPEEDDDMEVEYDDDGNPIYTPKKKVETSFILLLDKNSVKP